MKSYEEIANICRQNSELSGKLLDRNLLPMIARNERLDREIAQRLGRYRHVTTRFQKEWMDLLHVQYIGHRVFKKNGLIKKYRNHIELKKLNDEEQRFIDQAIEHPWYFRFSVIIEEPFTDFYQMEDVFTGEKFLLYSPGVSTVRKEQQPILWFNLISFNGYCWQSYGPIGGYNSFEPDDIFFFATELNATIESEEDLLDNLERNPIPYMLLLSGANYPLSVHREDQLIQAVAEYDLPVLDTKGMNQDFKVEYAHEVYRLSPKAWDDYPHLASAYYDEKQQVILLYAMTDRGFGALAQTLQKHGVEVDTDPYIRVNMSMVATTESILKKEIHLNPYDELFEQSSSPEDKEFVNKLNDFMALVLPDINAGRQPDIESLAEKAGVDLETARDVLAKVTKNMNLRKK